MKETTHTHAQRIAICMGTHNPEPGLFRAQIESIRAQTHEEWTCVISDDASDPERYEAICAEVEGDARFHVTRSSERLGFYRNFERAIGAADPRATYLALADHDDRWYPEKLEALLAALLANDAVLAYSDARAVDAEGNEIRATMWPEDERPNQWNNLATLLIANTVTGAASLFTRSLVDRALPFPALPGEPYHDHWLASVALASGELAYVDRPLYDWVRHGASVVVGESAKLRPADFGRVELHPRAAFDHGLRASAGVVVRGWRQDEESNLRRLELMSTALEERVASIEPSKSRQLRLIARSDSVTGVVWLTGRWLASRVRLSASLGRELLLLRGVGWRRLNRARQTLRRRAG